MYGVGVCFYFILVTNSESQNVTYFIYLLIAIYFFSLVFSITYIIDENKDPEDPCFFLYRKYSTAILTHPVYLAQHVLPPFFA